MARLKTQSASVSTGVTGTNVNPTRSATVMQQELVGISNFILVRDGRGARHMTQAANSLEFQAL